MASPTSRHLFRLLRSVPLPRLKQGSTLSVTALQPTRVVLQSEWRDDGQIDFQKVCTKKDEHASSDVDMFITHEDERITSLGRLASHISVDIQKSVANLASNATNEIHEWEEVDITENNNDTVPGNYLSVKIPEKMNVTVRLEEGGSIDIPSKIEGDVSLMTKDGDVRVKKLRGHKISIETQANNVIYASDLLEADQLTVKTRGRVRTKQIHGNVVDISVESDPNESCSDSLFDEDDEGSLVDVGSIYIAGQGNGCITVSSCHPMRRAIRVKSHHGPLRALVVGASPPEIMSPVTHETYPLIEMGGVNGNVEVEIKDTVGDESDWTSSIVHFDSLATDSVSLITADSGDIALTVDRKVEADVRLLSTTLRESLPNIEQLLAEEEDNKSLSDSLRNISVANAAANERISIQTKSFTSRGSDVTTCDLEFINGWVDNKSEEPDSRFERKTKGDKAGSVGKIRLDYAASQALTNFSATEGDLDNRIEHLRPLIAVVGTNKIALESVSWIGAIARRYGFDEEARDPGRTASRRGRSLIPRTES